MVLERGKPDYHGKSLSVLSTQPTKATQIQRNFGVRFIIGVVTALTTQRKSKTETAKGFLHLVTPTVKFRWIVRNRVVSGIGFFGHQFCPVLTPPITPIFDFHEVVSAQENVSKRVGLGGYFYTMPPYLTQFLQFLLEKLE